ncbi:MAG: hypothetical protein PHI27_07825 [Eubacteriales bacterium]|nr:hypothetical protein [Eubacteriales bacterium]MDD3882145.1 hypothetical protein [Eubacteriales bacterium]MDD4513250.1 hypothetical protein [Eubacteriales bacterium]
MKKLISLLLALAMLLTASVSFAEDAAIAAPEAPNRMKLQFSMKAGDLSAFSLDEATEKGIRALIDAISFTASYDEDSFLVKSVLNSKDCFTMQADMTDNKILLASNALSQIGLVFDTSAAQSLFDEKALEGILAKLNEILGVLTPYIEDCTAWAQANASLATTEEGTFEDAEYDAGTTKTTMALPGAKVCELMETLVKRAESDENLRALIVSSGFFADMKTNEAYQAKMNEIVAYWTSEETRAIYDFTETLTCISGEGVSFISISVGDKEFIRFAKKTDGDTVNFTFRMIRDGSGMLYKGSIKSATADVISASDISVNVNVSIGAFNENNELVSGMNIAEQFDMMLNLTDGVAQISGEEAMYSVTDGKAQKLLSMPAYLSLKDNALDMSVGIRIGDSTETALSMLFSAAPTEETIPNVDTAEMKLITFSSEIPAEDLTALQNAVQVGVMRVVANFMAAVPEDTMVMVNNIMQAFTTNAQAPAVETVATEAVVTEAPAAQ